MSGTPNHVSGAARKRVLGTGKPMAPAGASRRGRLMAVDDTVPVTLLRLIEPPVRLFDESEQVFCR